MFVMIEQKPFHVFTPNLIEWSIWQTELCFSSLDDSIWGKIDQVIVIFAEKLMG